MANSDEHNEDAGKEESRENHGQARPRRLTYEIPTQSFIAKIKEKYEAPSGQNPSWGAGSEPRTPRTTGGRRPSSKTVPNTPQSARSATQWGNIDRRSSLRSYRPPPRSPTPMTSRRKTTIPRPSRIQRNADLRSRNEVSGKDESSSLQDTTKDSGAHSRDDRLIEILGEEPNPFDTDFGATVKNVREPSHLAQYWDSLGSETVGGSSTKLDAPVEECTREEQAISKAKVKFAQDEKGPRKETLAIEETSKPTVKDASVQTVQLTQDIPKPNPSAPKNTLQLSRQNRNTQIDLHHAHDTIATLHDQSTHHLTLAHHWKNEYTTSTQRHEQRTTGLENALNAQITEILLYIKAYHDKLHDPQYWEYQGLHAKIQELQWELETMGRMFEDVKRGKARVEEQMEKVVGWNRFLEGRVREYMEGGGGGGGSVSLASGSSSSGSGSGSWPVTPVTPGAKRVSLVPRCLEARECRKREVRLEAVRVEQRRRREEEKGGRRAVMERVRRWALDEMGIAYPPDTGAFRMVAGKSSWEIWGGEEWYGNGPEVSEEDVVVIGELRKLVKENAKKRVSRHM